MLASKDKLATWTSWQVFSRLHRAYSWYKTLFNHKRVYAPNMEKKKKKGGENKKRVTSINPQTHACDLRDSWLPTPHSCCKQRTLPTLGHDQSPLLQAAKKKKKTFQVKPTVGFRSRKFCISESNSWKDRKAQTPLKLIFDTNIKKYKP